MKSKLRKKHQNKTAPLPIPEERIRTAREGEIPLRLRQISGKWQGAGTVAWQVSLPLLPQEKDNVYLDKLRDSYLRFLKQEAKKQRSEVWFGGMEWESTPEGLLLKTAFCPFSQREYRPKALFVLDEAGALSKICLRRHARSRNQSPSLPSHAASSAQRQSTGQGERTAPPSRRRSEKTSSEKTSP